MWIVTTIVIPFLVTAVSVALASKRIYEAGKTDGAVDCMSQLSMEGEALILTCPYDDIDEDYAEHVKKFLICKKEEHKKAKINRRIYDDERVTCYRQAEGRKRECRRSSGLGEDTD